MKPWYESKGMWGSLTAIVGAVCMVGFQIAAIAGHPVGAEDQQQLVTLLSGLVSGVGGLFGWWGRRDATSTIRTSKSGTGSGSLLGALALVVLLPALIACPANMKPLSPEERIEATELTLRQAQTSIVNLTCTRFEAGTGKCIDPGKPLDPDEAIELHDRLATAREALSAVTGFVDANEGPCFGQVRSVSACLDQIDSVLLVVQSQIPVK